MTTRGFTAVPPQVFGTWYQDVIDATETSTTSTTTYATKLTLTTPSTLPSGTYLIGWRFVWRAANANRSMDVRIRQDTTDLITFREFESNLEKRGMISGFVQTGTISGTNSFTLEFRVGGSNTTVYMQQAALQLWRVT